MKRRLIFLPAVVCFVGFVSCNTAAKKSSQSDVSKTEAMPATIAGLFDPGGLVAGNQHKVDTIKRGLKFAEGPAVDKEGNVYFSDQPDDRIYKWNAVTGEVTLFLQGCGRPNGMAFDKNGDLIVCAEMFGEIRKIHMDGTQEVLAKGYNGKTLNGPNDVWINPVTGGMYITDPIFPRDFWEPNDPRRQSWPPTKSPQAESGKGGHVYYLAPGSKTLVRVSTMAEWKDDIWPNGVVGTTDGKKLYINNWTGDNSSKLWSFDINKDGTLSNMKVLVSNLSASDGMSLDEYGNIYVSGGAGVNVFDPKTGNKILMIPAGGNTNNVFAGKNNKVLFITAPPRVSSVQMNVKGVEKY